MIPTAPIDAGQQEHIRTFAEGLVAQLDSLTVILGVEDSTRVETIKLYALTEAVAMAILKHVPPQSSLNVVAGGVEAASGLLAASTYCTFAARENVDPASETGEIIRKLISGQARPKGLDMDMGQVKPLIDRYLEHAATAPPGCIVQTMLGAAILIRAFANAANLDFDTAAVSVGSSSSQGAARIGAKETIAEFEAAAERAAGRKPS